MQISVSIDCTPEEARTLMGLPDLKPVHDKVVKEFEGQVLSAMHAMDATNLLKAWLPLTIGTEQLKAFASAMTPGLTEKR